MIKKTGRYVFFVVVYLSGIAIGGIYAPEAITYAKQMNADTILESQKIQQKSQPAKKRFVRYRQLG